MRIPLDYYRILGLPIQATAEQLQQAHRDRALQLPRREYSEAAIAARKQLLDEAYTILSDPEQRQDYDASFLAKTYDLDAEPLTELSPGSTSDTISYSVGIRKSGASGQDAEKTASSEDSDPHVPSVEIQDDQLVGALLILLELGEYELVLKLGRPYLSSGSLASRTERFGDPEIVLADIVLTIALACLELGREQWQQGQYQNAAESLETGQELLLREGLFASVRGEIQADLYKLRPYRILELLALPEANVTERRLGLQMLRDMLQERGGIDGTGNDQSGLNIDDFLRFIQQLRNYLTAAEQQTLFEEEAHRPSAVATYLAVYALLAQGFSQRQPALIRRAKFMLMRLGSRQDVHLEQAVCALLLGQTEEASRALELSQEYEPLAFIREHSQGSPDLLPGLCLYGERWLQAEVFPHFRDLAQQQASLKDYFADEQVQAYLEALPNEADAMNEWTVVSSQRASNGTTSNGTKQQAESWSAPPSAVAATATATLNAPTGQTAPASTAVSSMPTAERVSQLSPEGGLSGSKTRRASAGSASETVGKSRPPATERVRGQVDNGFRVPDVEDLPPRRAGSSARRSGRTLRMLFLVILTLLLLGGLGWLGVQAYGWLRQMLQNASGPALEGEQPMLQLDQPPVEIPDLSRTSSAIAGPLTQAVAQQVVQTWLSTKAAALGPEYATTQLEQILVEPALSQWQRQSQDAKQGNWYGQYKHSIKQVNSVQVNESNPDQGRVEAEVSETAEFYTNGRLDQGSSYSNDSLRVRYDLVRKDGQWRIQDMVVLR